MKKYIFDIDGTLTASRAQIDPDFRAFMLVFAWEMMCILLLVVIGRKP